MRCKTEREQIIERVSSGFGPAHRAGYWAVAARPRPALAAAETVNGRKGHWQDAGNPFELDSLEAEGGLEGGCRNSGTNLVGGVQSPATSTPEML